ncbi:MAG: alkaline phosphatase family protein [Kofleriaceae bacterium]
MKRIAALVVAGLAVVIAVVLGNRARLWNDELGLRSPLADTPPMLADPHTPRLTDSVVLVTIDGLGIDESHLPFLDELRARGVDAVAEVPYPTISRPNYVTILTGVPPADSGVRANRVTIPIAIDTVLDRVQAGGMRVGTAGDAGMQPSLFARHTKTLNGMSYRETTVPHATQLTPIAPVTWPVDDARRANSLAELAPVIAELARTTAFVPVLVLDVDRNGHAHGIGPEYRQAAREVDAMLRDLVSQLDLHHITLIITADHGHVAPGGHGGPEREVKHTPLILVGAGVRAGARIDPKTIDIAPTVAALLGVPAPGHAEGRTLVDAIDLDRAQATRRLALDALRDEVMSVSPPARPIGWRLLLAIGVAVIVIALIYQLRRVLDLRAVVALAGTAIMFVAMAVVTRGTFSPSYVPSLARTVELTIVGLVTAVVIQTVASLWFLRQATDRTLAAIGYAVVGLGGSLVVLAFVRAWFAMPFVAVPSPFWMVAIPTLELGVAACAIGTALTLVISSASRR